MTTVAGDTITIEDVLTDGIHLHIQTGQKLLQTALSHYNITCDLQVKQVQYTQQYRNVCHQDATHVVKQTAERTLGNSALNVMWECTSTVSMPFMALLNYNAHVTDTTHVPTNYTVVLL